MNLQIVVALSRNSSCGSFAYSLDVYEDLAVDLLGSHLQNYDPLWSLHATQGASTVMGTQSVEAIGEIACIPEVQPRSYCRIRCSLYSSAECLLLAGGNRNTGRTPTVISRNEGAIDYKGSTVDQCVSQFRSAGVATCEDGPNLPMAPEWRRRL